VFGLILVSFLLAHVYTFSCYRGFMKLKVLKNHAVLPTWKYPEKAAQVLVSCDLNDDDLEAMLFEDLSHLARKSRHYARRAANKSSQIASTLLKKQVNITIAHHKLKVDDYICHPDVKATECGIAFPGHWEGARRPTFLEEYMPMSIRCFQRSCLTHKLIEHIRHWALFIVIVWTALFLCARHFMDNKIAERSSDLRDEASRTRSYPLHGEVSRTRSRQLPDGSHGADHGEADLPLAQPMSAQVFSGRNLC